MRFPLTPCPLARTRPGSGPAPYRFPAILALILASALLSCSQEDGGTGRSKGAPATRSGGGGARLAYQSALNWLGSGQPEKARGELERALEIDPRMTEAHFELGKLLVRESYVVVGSGSRDRTKLEQGLDHLQKALLGDPQAEYAYWIGRGYHIGEDLDRAIEFLDQAIEIDASYGVAHKRKGLVLLDQAKLEAAAASFEQAMPLLPNDGGLRFQYGTTLENLDQPEKALRIYEEAVQVDRTLPGPYGRLANLREKDGDSEGAAEAKQAFQVWKRYERDLNAARKRVQSRPDDPQALIHLAEQFFAAEQWAEALQWFSQVLRIDARDAYVHMCCGIARRELGELEFAVHHLEEACFLAPDSLDPKLHLIRACLMAGKEDRMKEVFQQIEEEAPEDVVAHHELGLVSAELDLDERARRYLKKAVELDPVYVPGRLSLAAFLAEAGETDKAREQYEYVLTLAPGNEVATQALEELSGTVESGDPTNG